MSIRLAIPNDQMTWNSHVTHPLQSWEWGEFRAHTGVSVKRFVIENNNKHSNWQLTVHPIPHTPWSIGYFPKGPMPNREMLKELIEYGKQHNIIYIQLEPNVVIDRKTERWEDGKTKNSLSSSLTVLSSYRLIPSHHPLFTKYTFILDLTKSEDELLKSMHSKTRYNIKLAQKHNVLVREDNSDNAFESYLHLTQETTDRQAFYAHDDSYHRAMWTTLHRSGLAHLWTVSYNKQILAAWIIFTFGNAIYYPYGASSREHRSVMAPNLLLWEITKWGRHNGYKRFDLWGALGPEPDSNDPWYGFHKFKEGYNPELVEFVGSYDLVINKPLYWAFVLVNKVRWTVLHLLKR